MAMYVHGVGMTSFGYQTTPTHLMAYEAAMEAFDDAGMTMKDIDAVVVATMEHERNGEHQSLYSAVIASTFQTHIPILHVTAYCGGGAVALWTAVHLPFDTVLVLATDRFASSTRPEVTDAIMKAVDNVWEQREGLNLPAACAFFALHYMEKYKKTIDDFNLIPYKNHCNARYNPKSPFYGKTVSLEDIKFSKIVASPLRIHDCSLTVNGACAVIISRNKKSDIRIVGSAMVSDTISAFERKEQTSWKASVLAAQEAYKQAGIQPTAIDVAEVHDAFSITEVMAYEDLGFAEAGKGLDLVLNGVTFLEGALPINPSGGLKARGHPISPSGLAQIYEIVKQFRGKAEPERQIQKPLHYGLTHNVGGTGGVVGVHILEKLA